MITKIQYLGNVGATRTIPVVVDEDGSDQLRFKTLETDNNIIDTFELEKFKSQVDSGIDKLDDHWIGE